MNMEQHTRREFMGLSLLAGMAYARGNREADVDAIPLVEMHGHISTDQGMDLVRQERLSYILIMSQPYQLPWIAKYGDWAGACVWLNPTDRDHLEIAEKALKEYPQIVKGFKLHPPSARYRVSYDLLAGLFELANAKGLMIQSHTEREWCNAALFQPLMAKVPQTTLLLIHGYPADETFALVNAYPNVYVDNSYTAWGEKYQQAALKAIGRRKIVYGIDSPEGFPTGGGRVLPHYRQAAREIAAFYRQDLDVISHVFYRNAERILTMTFRVPPKGASTPHGQGRFDGGIEVRMNAMVARHAVPLRTR
jgi:predicted TIM-barrel fold metal-dependent hydrolase